MIWNFVFQNYDYRLLLKHGSVLFGLFLRESYRKGKLDQEMQWQDMVRMPRPQQKMLVIIFHYKLKGDNIVLTCRSQQGLDSNYWFEIICKQDVTRLLLGLDFLAICCKFILKYHKKCVHVVFFYGSCSTLTITDHDIVVTEWCCCQPVRHHLSSTLHCPIISTTMWPGNIFKDFVHRSNAFAYWCSK